MPKLLIKTTNVPAREIELKLGTNRVGRNADNDIQIIDGSVSGTHCEMILLEDGNVYVRDLGSTNGTFLDRQPVTETYFQDGQTLHIGGIEVVYKPQVAAAPKTGLRVAAVESTPFAPAAAAATAAAPAAKAGLKISPMAHSAPAAAAPAPATAAHRYVPQPQVYQTFFQRLPSTFSYPFKRNGLILLIVGTGLFVLLDFLGKFSTRIAILAFGYLFLYMQSIVNYSATGNDDMPEWPEVSSWWDDILYPAIMLGTCFLVSFGPVAWFWIFVDLDPGLKWTIGIAMLVFGCCYLPMALLAVAMYNTVFALNPLLIIPSMVKIPLEYLVACVVLVVVLGIRVLSATVLDMIPIPVVPTVIAGFLSLYFLTVEMRILGVMYNSKSDELNWNF